MRTKRELSQPDKGHIKTKQTEKPSQSTSQLMRDCMLLPKNGNKIRLLFWPLLFNTELENLAR